MGVADGVVVADDVTGAFVFAFGGGDHGFDAVLDAAVEIAGFEAGGDFVVDDLFAEDVGECAFKAVAGDDLHFVVVGEDEEDGAVAFAFLADLPGVEDAGGVGGDVVVGLHVGVEDDDDLVGGVAFELFELVVEVVGDGGGENVGIVEEVARRGEGGMVSAAAGRGWERRSNTSRAHKRMGEPIGPRRRRRRALISGGRG